MKTCIDCNHTVITEFLKCEHCRYIDMITLRKKLKLSICLSSLMELSQSDLDKVIQHDIKTKNEKELTNQKVKTKIIPANTKLKVGNENDLKLDNTVVEKHIINQIIIKKITTQKLNEKRKKWRKTHPFVKMSKSMKSQYKVEITPLQFWRLVKSQKCLCAISGLKLTSDNISIDHIIPRSKGGTHDISNLQLVTKIVNNMRSNYDIQDFVELCTQIVKYNE